MHEDFASTATAVDESSCFGENNLDWFSFSVESVIFLEDYSDSWNSRNKTRIKLEKKNAVHTQQSNNFPSS